MIEYRIEDAFDLDAAAYWDMFFSDDYADKLWPAVEVECQVLEFDRKGTGDNETIHRVQKLTPKREVPAVLKRLVEGGIAYTEHNEFSRKQSEMQTITIPSFFADKLETKGVYRVEPNGEGKCLRVWEGTCKCSVALIGGRIEKQIVDEVKESYVKATEFTRTYIANLRT